MKIIPKFTDYLYNKIVSFFYNFGEYFILFFNVLKFLPRVYKDRKLIISQMVHIGVNSLMLVAIIGLFTGAISAWQVAYQITDFISINMVGSATPKAIIIELGPVLAALVLAGRVGASIAAELGTMKVTEQIDALESMAINPTRYLAMPRIVATTLVMPVLVIYASTIAIFGSYLVSIFILGIPSATYLNGFRENFEMKDVMASIIKALFFGVSISSIGCFYGFKATEGAQGVGEATIKSFVLSAAMILILDSILWNFLIG